MAKAIISMKAIEELKEYAEQYLDGIQTEADIRAVIHNLHYGLPECSQSGCLKACGESRLTCNGYKARLAKL
jgi:hypothetical protein